MNIENSEYEVRIAFHALGVVSKDDMFNELKLKINTLKDSDPNLIELLDNSDLIIKVNPLSTDGLLITKSNNHFSASLFAAIIESIDMVGVVDTRFSLVRIQNSGIIKDAINVRANEIAQERLKDDYIPKLHSSWFRIQEFRNMSLRSIASSSFANKLDFTKPEFTILISLILLIVIPLLVVGGYGYTDNVMIAIYVILTAGVLWKFILYLIQKPLDQKID